MMLKLTDDGLSDLGGFRSHRVATWDGLPANVSCCPGRCWYYQYFGIIALIPHTKASRGGGQL